MDRPTQEEIDEQMIDHEDDLGFEEEEYDPGEECGRWMNGSLSQHCTLAGTEFCDWECPYSH